MWRDISVGLCVRWYPNSLLWKPRPCDGDDDLVDQEGMAPAPKCWRPAMEVALQQSLASGLYPQFSGCEGLSQLLVPSENKELEFKQLVCPTSLCELIANKFDIPGDCYFS